jgi:hypothetical protein
MKSASCKIAKFAVILRGLVNQYSVQRVLYDCHPWWRREWVNPTDRAEVTPSFFIFYFYFSILLIAGNLAYCETDYGSFNISHKPIHI